ncbi:unnamed protein product [Darwinula stevensoni]|uniref:Alpha-1,3/1,6-mannosyltransferase ALG2 n=1 Tax=Darwinula stevensoni TaxID=69355 RepID=A0A7R8X828_9CRUS|nr:unnamed protein product [Darwinula stevensoni]CAG0881153.1 unnamed protein product [Darwinula stevensoni]
MAIPRGAEAPRTMKQQAPFFVKNEVHGSGGRVAASGGTLSSYIIRNLGLSKKVEDNQDPREALLKFAKEAAENPYYVTPAYQLTQPKPIFAEPDAFEDEQPKTKKSNSLCIHWQQLSQTMVNVIFLHPDLGIGGAERLVVDAALALQSRGHVVRFITNHHDRDHCFRETYDGTLGVVVVGDWLPRSIFGRCQALCAYIRMIYAALYLILFSGINYEVVFCDQISACIPLFKLSNTRVIFYCHFPDQLLSQRSSTLKMIYRAPLDFLEGWSTGLADLIFVNSNFTASVFHDTFKNLKNVKPQVLYPSLHPATFDLNLSESIQSIIPSETRHLFLSINRFERKKNLALALHALREIKDILNPEEFQGIHMVIAGGYDKRVMENVEHYKELSALMKELGLERKVTLMKSPSDSEKLLLLRAATSLIYTPEHEHFGIVPLEAMYMQKPVIAVNSGGPMETILDGETGFLCDPTPKAFAVKMAHFIQNPESRSMGMAGKKRVETDFSFETFTNALNEAVSSLLPENGK